jgi:hypothetical protein
MEPQDEAEALDDDRLAGEYPPEEPIGVDAYGTTGDDTTRDSALEREAPLPSEEEAVPVTEEPDR